MKTTRRLVFDVLVIIGCAIFTFGAMRCHAGDWTTEDKISESIYQTANLVDTFQTVYIAQHPANFYEARARNIIGEHPSTGRVYAYMASVAVTHAIITDLLIRSEAPIWVRRTWQVVTIGEKLDNVGNNINIGVRFAF